MFLYRRSALDGAAAAALERCQPPELSHVSKLPFGTERRGHSCKVSDRSYLGTHATPEWFALGGPSQVVVALCPDGGRDHLQLAVVRDEFDHWFLERRSTRGAQAPSRRSVSRGTLAVPRRVVAGCHPEARERCRDRASVPRSLGGRERSRRSLRISLAGGQAPGEHRTDRTVGGPQPWSLVFSSSVRSRRARLSGDKWRFLSSRSSNDVSRSLRTSGISNPHASMTARKLSILGDTSPCSQRAISDRAMPLRSASSSCVRPARVRASRMGSAPRTDLSLRQRSGA